MILFDPSLPRSVNHLQLGRDLYDRKKFGREVIKYWRTTVTTVLEE